MLLKVLLLQTLHRVVHRNISVVIVNHYDNKKSPVTAWSHEAVKDGAWGHIVLLIMITQILQSSRTWKLLSFYLEQERQFCKKYNFA